ncbi:MAG: penicillin-binding protein 1B, partial [Piscirickettsiaceae bacterium]
QLTGSQGALQVWASVMKAITKQGVNLTPPNDITFTWVDSLGLRANESCADAVQYPFIIGSEPIAASPCVSALDRNVERAGQWFDELFNNE